MSEPKDLNPNTYRDGEFVALAAAVRALIAMQPDPHAARLAVEAEARGVIAREMATSAPASGVALSGMQDLLSYLVSAPD